MLSLLKKWKAKRLIRELEIQQNRSMREIVIAMTTGEVIPSAPREKLRLLDARIDELRNLHK